MLLNSPIREVAPAATESVVSESYDGYTMRSIVARLVKPRSSARRAQSTTVGPETASVFGNPIPMSMRCALRGRWSAIDHATSHQWTLAYARAVSGHGPHDGDRVHSTA
jgi:hypothetical protein